MTNHGVLGRSRHRPGSHLSSGRCGHSLGRWWHPRGPMITRLHKVVDLTVPRLVVLRVGVEARPLPCPRRPRGWVLDCHLPLGHRRRRRVRQREHRRGVNMSVRGGRRAQLLARAACCSAPSVEEDGSEETQNPRRGVASTDRPSRRVGVRARRHMLRIPRSPCPRSCWRAEARLVWGAALGRPPPGGDHRTCSLVIDASI